MSKDNSSTQEYRVGSRSSIGGVPDSTLEKNEPNRAQIRISKILSHLKTKAAGDDPVSEPVQSELLKLILEGSRNIQSMKGKKVVVVCGSTGSGKSTLISYLIGMEMQLTDARGKPIEEPIVGIAFRCNPEDKRKAPTIGFGDNSQTIHPEAYPSHRRDDDLTYLDLAGFFDTRGDNYGLWSRVASDLAILAVSEITSLIITMQYSDFQVIGKRSPQFPRLCMVLKNLFFKNDSLPQKSAEESMDAFIESLIESAKQKKKIHNYCNNP